VGERGSVAVEGLGLVEGAGALESLATRSWRAMEVGGGGEGGGVELIAGRRRVEVWGGAGGEGRSRDHYGRSGWH